MPFSLRNFHVYGGGNHRHWNQKHKLSPKMLSNICTKTPAWPAVQRAVSEATDTTFSDQLRFSTIEIIIVFSANIQTASLLFNYPNNVPIVFPVQNFMQLNNQSSWNEKHKSRELSTQPQTDTNLDITANTNAQCFFPQFLHRTAGKQEEMKCSNHTPRNFIFYSRSFSILVGGDLNITGKEGGNDSTSLKELGMSPGTVLPIYS